MPEQSAHVHLLLPAEMRDQLRETAAANFRSVSGEVRAALAEHFKASRTGPGLRAVGGNRMTVEAAHQAVPTAKTKVADAEAALDEALDARDRALADVGWRRLVVREPLNRVRSSRSDLRDSRFGADVNPGPDGTAGRAFRGRGRPAGDNKGPSREHQL